MYEDKSVPFHINWKSLLIKLGILLVVVFIVLFLISIFTKNEAKESNFGTNLSAMRDAATEYFVGSRLPEDVGESESITLEEMFEQNLLLDEEGNSCNTTDSYAEATKLDEENYRLEVTLVCENDSDTIVNTIKRTVQEDDTTEDDENNENNVVDTPEEEEPLEEENTNNNNNSSNNNSNQNNGTATNRPSNPPSNNTNNNNGNNTSNSNGNTGNNNSNNNGSNTTDDNQNVITNTCYYGKKEYTSLYPLAYLVDGNCAVGSLYTYANKANDVYIREYQKLVQEMNQLNSDIVVKTHDSDGNSYITPIKNTAGTGYVGYQMFFKAVLKNTYSEKTVYAYYLDLNGNRKVIIDNRNNI